MSAIADRISRAHQNKEDFHVVLVLPLKSEVFEDWKGVHLNAQKQLTNLLSKTIARGKHSLHKKVGHDIIHKYFSVYGLRTHGILNKNHVTEIIYVHSKVMIVDDRLAIIGSANINDRSMIGSRDSEIAVKIEDLEMIDGKMNGQPFKVGRFSHSLRIHLIKEHLGLLSSQDYKASGIKVEDPIDTDALHKLKVIAKTNTEIYKSLFCITPNDNYRTLEHLYYAIKHQCSLQLGDINLLDKCQGNLAKYELFYLEDHISKQSYIEIFFNFVTGLFS